MNSTVRFMRSIADYARDEQIVSPGVVSPAVASRLRAIAARDAHTRKVIGETVARLIGEQRRVVDIIAGLKAETSQSKLRIIP